MKKLFLIGLIGLVIFFFFGKPARAASLGLFSSFSSLKVGEEFWLEVKLNAQDQDTLGTDVILVFEPGVLEATGIEEGNLYSSYLGKKIDNDQGRVYLSGATGYGKPVRQSGVLGKVGFLAKAPGETKISFEWQAGETNDTNVVPYEGNEDLLSMKPNDFEVTIKQLSLWEKIITFIKKVVFP